MVQATVEQRLDRLEETMNQLLTRFSSEKQRQKDWRRTIGSFDDDPLMKEIIDDALQAREEERARFHGEYANENTDS